MTKNETFRNWINQYSAPLLKRAVFLISDKTEAEDIVQDVLLPLFILMNLLKAKAIL